MNKDNTFKEIQKQVKFSDIANAKNHDEPGKSTNYSYYHCQICGDNDPALKVYQDGNWKCHSCGAKDGKFIGYACYGDAKVAAVFLVKEYRDQGIGTEMMEEWYSQTDHDTVPVAAWDDTKPFFRKLSFPVEFV